MLVWAWGGQVKLCTFWKELLGPEFSDGDGFAAKPGPDASHWRLLLSRRDEAIAGAMTDTELECECSSAPAIYSGF